MLCFDDWDDGESEVWGVDVPESDLVDRALDVTAGFYDIITEDLLADYDCAVRYDHGTNGYAALSDEVCNDENG